MLFDMTKAEEIRRDAALKDAIERGERNWLAAITEEERSDIRMNVRFYVDELSWVLSELNKAERAPDAKPKRPATYKKRLAA